jgi:hypothetical protein
MDPKEYHDYSCKARLGVELTQKLLIITEGMQLLKREIKLPGRLK